MNIFGIGLPEMAVILVLALLVFGPKKLPEIGRSLGKTIRSFQDASKDFEAEFKREAEQIEKIVKQPMEAILEPSQAVLSASTTEAATPTPVENPIAPEVVATADEETTVPDAALPKEVAS